MEPTVQNATSKIHRGQRGRLSLPFDLQLQILLCLIPTDETFDVKYSNIFIDDTDVIDAAVAASTSDPDYYLVVPTRPRPTPPVPRSTTAFYPRMYQPITEPQSQSLLSLLLVHPSLTPHLLQHLYSTSHNIFHFDSLDLLHHFHHTVPPAMIPLIRRISISACGPSETVDFASPASNSTINLASSDFLAQRFGHVPPTLHNVSNWFPELDELRLPGVRAHVVRHAWHVEPGNRVPAMWTARHRYEYLSGSVMALCYWRPDMIRLLADIVIGTAAEGTQVEDSCLRDGTVLRMEDSGTRILRRGMVYWDHDAAKPAYGRANRDDEIDLLEELRKHYELRDRLKELWESGTRVLEW